MNEIYIMDSNLMDRPTPRILQGLKALLRVIDPEALAEKIHSKGMAKILFDKSPHINHETLVNTHQIIVEKESENLLRALVPVDELVSLAEEASVLSVRLPDRPVVQGRSKLEEEEVKK